MEVQNPKIVLGMPVYNGENYVREAIESILAQTFTQFRLLISDNASSDATAAICQEYACRDRRVSYYRQAENIGATPNFNFVFQPGAAPYFKWAAHDDVLEPDYLRRCADLLDGRRELVIAHCRTRRIDHQGCSVGSYDRELRLDGARPSDRFWRILWVGHFTEVFGLMRSQAVATTGLYGSFVGADRNFMADLLLRGDIGYVDEVLFSRRHHVASFCDALSDDAARLKWFDPKARKPSFLAGPIKFQVYLRSILAAPISRSERLRCAQVLLEWGARRGIEKVTGVGEHYRRRLAGRLP